MLALHNKTGNIYEILYEHISDCTGDSEKVFTVYRRVNTSKIYVREQWEFDLKFIKNYWYFIQPSERVSNVFKLRKQNTNEEYLILSTKDKISLLVEKLNNNRKANVHIVDKSFLVCWGDHEKSCQCEFELEAKLI